MLDSHDTLAEDFNRCQETMLTLNSWTSAEIKITMMLLL